ncbi:MAG: galactokinase [Actinomycetota bacterium]|nr:galactokinase [Actinomycetota bacterium]
MTSGTPARPDWGWAAPGRVNLMGEHTDYNDGWVLPFAIRHRTKVALCRRDDDRVRVHSTQQDDSVETTASTVPGDVSGWAGYVAGVVWALGVDGHRIPGVDLWVDSDVPMGAGLSSSAALACATALALDELAGAGLDAAGIADIARRAENDYVRAPTGVMDQLASVHGRAGHALLIDTRNLTVEHHPARFVEDGYALLVIDTGATHALADGGGYAERRGECERAAELLGVPALRDVTTVDLDRLDDEVLRRRARHVVTEDARVLDCVQLLGAGDWAAVGTSFAASHASMRDDFEISCDELDVAVGASVAAGAVGARMTGGGFGGSVIALVAAGDADTVAGGCRRAFAEHGWDEPKVFAVEPGPGAARL